MIQDAWGWCTGMIQRDGMGKEVGGGFRMGNTCTPVWIHVGIWQNQYNIVKLKKTHTQYYIGSRYLELKFLKIPFTIAPKNEIPNYKSNKICTYLCPEDYGTVWEKIK